MATIITLDINKLYLPKEEERGLWVPEVVVKEYRLKKHGKNSYISAMKYDYEKRLIVPNPEITPDFIVHMPCDKHSSGGDTCPVCLQKFLAENEDYRIHYRGIVMRADTPDPVMLRYYGDGDVEVLHWGMAGEIGVCYACSGGWKPHY